MVIKITFFYGITFEACEVKDVVFVACEVKDVVSTGKFAVALSLLFTSSESYKIF
jgi:hypothetical protein